MKIAVFCFFMTVTTPAHALCLKSTHTESSPSNIMGGIVGKIIIDNQPARMWPENQQNLWVNTSKSKIWIKILGDDGYISQSFKIENPEKSCIVFDSLYRTYRDQDGYRKGQSCDCKR